MFDCGQGSLVDARLAALRGPLWFVRAGTWPARRFTVSRERFPPPSATRRAVCALGAVVPELGDANPAVEVREWSAALHASGGDFSAALARRRALLPALASVYVDDELRAHILPLLAAGLTLSQCLLERASRAELRVLRYAALDVHASEHLRVAQVVTSLQRGGAERMALDLSGELPRCGVESRVYSVYSPTRNPFPAPLGAVELAKCVRPGADRDARFDVLADELAANGTDLVHAHLLDGADLERLSSRGYRSVVTVHNTRAGFPAGLAHLDAAHVALWVACSRGVEDELVRAGIEGPRRTVWNGIRVTPLAMDREARRRASRWRSELGLDESGILLTALANPRPQKRLHLFFAEHPRRAAGASRALGKRGEARGGGRRVSL